MRSNKATLTIRIRRLRNVYLRRRHLIWRIKRGIEKINKELARNEQLQRVMAKGLMSYYSAGTVLYERPHFDEEY